MQAASLLFAMALVGRAAQVQLVERNAWRDRARAQQLAASPLPAPRGTILDANGAVLVESRQLVKLAIAPPEVSADVRRRGDGAARREFLARALARAGVSPELRSRALDTARRWVEIPGRFLPSDVAAITTLRGVHATPALERVPPANDGLRRLVGRADDVGGAVDGLERSLDALLRGTGGRDSLVRDARGQRIRSPTVAAEPARPGNTVVLTINQGLQDIAERALGEAVTSMRATGGDIVVLDPHTGAVRAMASRRADRLATGATALTEPFEPGSTVKPFVAARLLDLERARPSEVITTHNGTWKLGARTIEDDHPMPSASLADVIRYSSNIGIVQLAQRLSAAEQYELLRDLGFGTPTGIPYPSEAAGTLRPPRQWDGTTAASLAMGYAIAVTPMQLAVAYAAIANGGELLEPAIVHEVRTPDGDVRYRHQRRVVRRVMSPASARAVRAMLKGVVETGTAAGSNLAVWDVAGKTGTARRAVGGRYVDGKYTASFVGMFPADDPQLVILVKLDDPTKSIYGGKAAAPVSRAVLQAALAARDAALDRRALASAPGAAPSRPGPGALAANGAARPPAVARAVSAAEAWSLDSLTASALDAAMRAPEPTGAVAWIVATDVPRHTAPPVVVQRPVPDVGGLTLRRAAYELHRAGFRAAIPAGAAGADRAAVTRPAAGTLLPTGSRVLLGRE